MLSSDLELQLKNIKFVNFIHNILTWPELDVHAIPVNFLSFPLEYIILPEFGALLLCTLIHSAI